MNAALAGYLVGSACYGLSTGSGIRFADRLTVPTAAAFAPAVAWSGLRLVGEDGWSILLCGPAVALVACLLTRRSLSELTGHLALFVVSVLLVLEFREVGLGDTLWPAIAGGALYLLGEYARQTLTRQDRRALIKNDRRTWWLLQAVLICACGLTLLGVRQLDWPAFTAMALVLALTKREFEAVALSRTTYEQTVQALDKLNQRASQNSLRARELE